MKQIHRTSPVDFVDFLGKLCIIFAAYRVPFHPFVGKDKIMDVQFLKVVEKVFARAGNVNIVGVKFARKHYTVVRDSFGNYAIIG